MEKQHFTDFYEAFQFISSHPANSMDRKVHAVGSRENHFWECLEIEVVKVDPDRRSASGCCLRSDDPAKNTKTEIWLEYGEWDYVDQFKLEMPCHDPAVDCGGDTFEEAIINLANLVYADPGYRYEEE